MIIDIIQVIAAILLIIAILMQQRGTGLGGAFGGQNTVYQTKRHMEKYLHYATIVLAIVFFATALANILL